MKDLTAYFECDGAATPATVMGMGNPMAPEGDSVGSGDTFDHQKRKKKVKPGKEKQEWPDDKGQDKANEGLLDDDFGMDDSDLGLGFDDMLDRFIAMYDGEEKPTEKDYEQFFNNFKAVAKGYSASQNIKDSIMKACRGKVYTVIAFYKKGLMGAKGSTHQNVIEIRKFVRNPRPEAFAIGWSTRGLAMRNYYVNHPTNINIQMSEWYALPGEVWNKLSNLE